LIEHLDGMPSAAPVIAQNFRARQWLEAGLRTIKHELLRAAHTWSPFSGTAWGCSLIIARFRRQSMRAGSHHTTIHACPFKKNSTLQHYDAIEIIARVAENCVCMFVIVSDRRNVRGVPHEFLYVQIFIIRRSCSPPRGEQDDSLVRVSH
jgi:hypothetical protein